jgi:hypothetical protein
LPHILRAETKQWKSAPPKQSCSLLLSASGPGLIQAQKAAAGAEAWSSTPHAGPLLSCPGFTIPRERRKSTRNSGHRCGSANCTIRGRVNTHTYTHTHTHPAFGGLSVETVPHVTCRVQRPHNWPQRKAMCRRWTPPHSTPDMGGGDPSDTADDCVRHQQCSLCVDRTLPCWPVPCCSLSGELEPQKPFLYPRAVCLTGSG